MELLIATLIGALVGSGIYCILRRNIMKVIIGIMLIGQGANLLVFTAAGRTTSTPAFVAGSNGLPPVGHADPLPQALVLTAIVISFGLTIFSVALLLRAYRAVRSDDLNDFNTTDQIS